MMKAEIIAIGTELLLGQIVNTNAQYLSRACAALGVDMYFQTVVGDNPARLEQAFRQAGERADLIICTGGLGPTQDDLTKDVLSALTGRSMSLHQPSMDKMTRMFQSRGIPMVDSNAKQAFILDGCEPLWNEPGLAVGIGLTHEGKHYVLLPGPPKEMKPMFEHYATPWIRSLLTDEIPLHSVMLKFTGIGESFLEHELIDLIEAQTDVTIAPYAQEGEVTIRLATRAETLEIADRKFLPIIERIKERVGSFLYAQEDISLEQVIMQILKDRKLTLAAAESCTGGLLSDLITAVPGSSENYLGAAVVYTNALKHNLLGVPMEVLEGTSSPGAVSPETAEFLAKGLLNVTGSDYALSITGVAGPSSSEGKPVGLVYIGLAERGKAQAEVFKVQLSGNREIIKLRAAKHALYQLWRVLVQG
jgi:nicotinamide-nucleotide amidase